jgi:hypothetical protein
MPSIDFNIFTPLDPRLGRHMMHDDRSRAFATGASKTRMPTTNVRHKRRAGIWNQGEIGSCTCNAELGLLMTEPFITQAGGIGKWHFEESDCVALYKLATRLDNALIEGVYEPDDTGSTFLYASKAAKKQSLIRSYSHTFGTIQFLNQLVQTPMSLGINWYEGMMETDRRGFVLPRGRLAGGHQICVDEINCDKEYIGFAQSWGDDWSPLDGWGRMSFDTLDRLLREDGDAGTVTL